MKHLISSLLILVAVVLPLACGDSGEGAGNGNGGGSGGGAGGSGSAVAVITPIGGCAPSGMPYVSSVDYSDRFPAVPECAELLNCIFGVYCPSTGQDENACRNGMSAAWCRPEENSPSSYTPDLLAGECAAQYADAMFDVCRERPDAG